MKASDILAECAFCAGFDVKKSEIHGMSQRGGSVTSDVRFGERVFSPMVPEGEADYLVALDESQVDHNRYILREGGVLVTPHALEVIHGPMAGLGERDLPLTSRNFNVAILGMLSVHLAFDADQWQAAIAANVPAHTLAQNMEVFHLGRRFA
jgi:indolepyruvate ferredoxin oxidoreductase beta subunit